jgi:hypothetical protein
LQYGADSGAAEHATELAGGVQQSGRDAGQLRLDVGHRQRKEGEKMQLGPPPVISTPGANAWREVPTSAATSSGPKSERAHGQADDQDELARDAINEAPDDWVSSRDTNVDT